MKKITIIGPFSDSLDGQTIKTVTFTNELKKIYGSKSVIIVNTNKRILSLFMIIFLMPFFLLKSSNILTFPAQNGVKIIFPFVIFWNKCFKRKIHYCVIGGWLPKLIDSNKKLCKKLKKLDFIYVETNTMSKLLLEKGFKNVTVLPNCKSLVSLSEDDLVYNDFIPYKICILSRVMKQKGIEDAITAITKVNDKYNKNVFDLDIYGPIDKDEKAWFDNLKASFPHFINYKGTVDFDKTVDVIKNYFILLFPTKFFTEGIPGTIIDAYASGVPVIASKWQNFSDIIEDGVSGISYEFDNVNSLIEVLECVIANPTKISNMKKYCLQKSKMYMPSEVVRKINL